MYFFDTYAFVEIYKGNSNYSKYVNSRFITTSLNLMELYNAILKESSKNVAEPIFQKYLNKCVYITPNILKEAVEFRLKFIKKTKYRLSYIDAIGYVTAKRLNIKFLTGDVGFKNLPNVEFVK